MLVTVKVKYEEEFEFDVDATNKEISQLKRGEFPFDELMVEQSMRNVGTWDAEVYDDKDTKIFP